MNSGNSWHMKRLQTRSQPGRQANVTAGNKSKRLDLHWSRTSPSYPDSYCQPNVRLFEHGGGYKIASCHLKLILLSRTFASRRVNRDDRRFFPPGSAVMKVREVLTSLCWHLPLLPPCRHAWDHVPSRDGEGNCSPLIMTLKVMRPLVIVLFSITAVEEEAPEEML